MSINEYKEFEAINQKVSERNAQEAVACHSTEDIYRAKKAKARKKAICFVLVTMVLLLVTILCITGLEMIGWINATFRILLMCLTGSVAMFKIGYFWHEIKN